MVKQQIVEVPVPNKIARRMPAFRNEMMKRRRAKASVHMRSVYERRTSPLYRALLMQAWVSLFQNRRTL